MKNIEIYNTRRKKLVERMSPNSVAIISSGGHVYRNGDSEYPFRVHSNFYYLTGFWEADSLLFISREEEILFVSPKDPFSELWTGKRLGELEAPARLSIKTVYPLTKLEEKIPSILGGKNRIYAEIFTEKFTPLRNQIFEWVKKINGKRNKDIEGVSDVHRILGHLRLYKDLHEIELLKQAVKITGIAFEKVISFCRPDLYEYQLQALMEAIFLNAGGQGRGYTTIVASGANALTMHYIENSSKLQEHEYVLIDAAAEFGNYTADISRTFPVNGKFSGLKKEIYQAVLQAQKNSITKIKPGTTFKQHHYETSLFLAENLVSVGVLQGNPEELVTSGEIRKLYPHGTSHWLGLEPHDECSYFETDASPVKFQAGMVLTVEPGVYFPLNSTYPKEIQGYGIRIEDDVLITKSGQENLSAAIPKEVSEIEEIYQRELGAVF